MQKKAYHIGKTLGPYSPGLEVEGGKMLFVSGQIPLDPDTGALVQGDFAQQADRVLKNMKDVLEHAGYSFADIVKLTIYLTDLANFTAVNEACTRYLKEPFPARATVQVAALPKDALIEIDAIAVR